MTDIDFYYRYAHSKFGKQTLNLFADINELYSMVNEVYTICKQKDPDCSKGYIINRINWAFLDMYNNAKKEANMYQQFELSTAGNMQETGVDFDFSGLQKESLYSAMQKLEPMERDILIRFYFKDETYNEIAEYYNVCINTIKRKMDIACKKLKNIL